MQLPKHMFFFVYQNICPFGTKFEKFIKFCGHERLNDNANAGN